MINKIRLLVAIEDDVYLDKICDFLETNHGRFTTERFSDKAALSQSLEFRTNYDVILFEPDMLSEESRRQISKIQIVLGDKDSVEMSNGCYSIREYQRIDSIASSVLNICSQDKRFIGIDVQATDKAKLYMMQSPLGGTGVTTVSLAVALHLAKAGKRTLYINLEQVSSLPALLPADGITMTQVMRMAIEHNPKLLTALEGGKQVEPISGLEYIAGFGDATDYDSLQPEHLQSLAKQLCGLGLYDVIIADVAWNTATNRLLCEHAEKIFLVSRNTMQSVMRVNAYLQYAGDKELSCRNRIQVVLNALSGQPSGAFTLAPVVSIPLYQMLIDTTSFTAAALGGGFSQACTELARQL